jgi:hypothetical protein
VSKWNEIFYDILPFQDGMASSFSELSAYIISDHQWLTQQSNGLTSREDFAVRSLSSLSSSSSMVLRPMLDPGLFFSFVIIFTNSVELLGRVISPSQGSYRHTGQHKHRIHTQTSTLLSGIRAHDPSVRAGDGSSCLRPHGHVTSFVLHYY